MQSDEKTQRHVLAILVAIILVNLITHISYFGTKEYEFSCLYMLLYLCINEVLKER